MRNLLSLIFLLSSVVSFACTSAMVTGEYTKNGRPLLWKHRDASDLNNKVEKIAGSNGRYEYVALFNSSDTLCKEAWIGFNSQGFAVMNTASYNLKNDTVKAMDHEGFVMSEALATCRTVDDFERLLRNLPKPLRVEANFGVIDAYGGAAYFETSNYVFSRFNVNGYMVRTNYSKSGRKDEGYGYVREQNAEYLLAPYLKSRTIEPAVFTEVLSRSFYHSLNDIDFSKVGIEWIVDKDFIPRYSSSASVVIEGVKGDESPNTTVMWTVLGYPPCGVVEPAMLVGNGVPSDLSADSNTGRSRACDRANELKEQVFPIKRDRGNCYVYIKALSGDSIKPGINQSTHKKSIENYKKGYAVIDLLRKKLQKE